MLAFVECDNGKSHLVGVQGKDIRKRELKEEKL